MRLPSPSSPGSYCHHVHHYHHFNLPSPQHRQAAAEVPAGDAAAAPAHHGQHPPAPGHHHHVRHEPQGLPREVPHQLTSPSGILFAKFSKFCHLLK